MKEKLPTNLTQIIRIITLKLDKKFSSKNPNKKLGREKVDREIISIQSFKNAD